MGGRHTLAAAALGQVLAALIGGTAVASTSLARQVSSGKTHGHCVKLAVLPLAGACRRRSSRRQHRLLLEPISTRILQGVSAPTLQSGINYLLLGVVYTAVRLRTFGWKLKCR